MAPGVGWGGLSKDEIAGLTDFGLVERNGVEPMPSLQKATITGQRRRAMKWARRARRPP